MNATELRAEMDYRMNERIALLGFTDPADRIPSWAASAATREVELWAGQNHPETLKLLNTK